MIIKCYYVSSGVKGLVNGKYMLFATESDYLEYLKENENE